MKIFDRNYRLFGVINPVDLVVILLVLAVGFVAFYLLRGGTTIGSGEELVPATVTLLVRDVRDDAIDVSSGDEVVKSGVGRIGDVKSVTTRSSLREVPTLEGNLNIVESGLFDDVVIVVEGEGRFTNSGVLVGQVLMKVNETIEIGTPRFDAKMTVIALDLDE